MPAHFASRHGFVIAAMCLVGGCGAQKLGSDLIILVGTENRDSVSVSRDQTVLLKLPAEISAGFIWTLATKDPQCVVTEQQTEEPPSHEFEGKVLQVFQMKFSRPGSANLRFVYSRGKHEQAIREYYVELKIR